MRKLKLNLNRIEDKRRKRRIRGNERGRDKQRGRGDEKAGRHFHAFTLLHKDPALTRCSSSLACVSKRSHAGNQSQGPTCSKCKRGGYNSFESNTLITCQMVTWEHGQEAQETGGETGDDTHSLPLSRGGVFGQSKRARHWANG